MHAILVYLWHSLLTHFTFLIMATTKCRRYRLYFTAHKASHSESRCMATAISAYKVVHFFVYVNCWWVHTPAFGPFLLRGKNKIKLHIWNNCDRVLFFCYGLSNSPLRIRAHAVFLFILDIAQYLIEVMTSPQLNPLKLFHRHCTRPAVQEWWNEKNLALQYRRLQLKDSLKVTRPHGCQ